MKDICEDEVGVVDDRYSPALYGHDQQIDPEYIAKRCCKLERMPVNSFLVFLH